jgi:CBS domain-containing protein
MQIRDVMTPALENIPFDASLMSAARRMKSLNVGSLPVCQDDKLIGMITDRDITIRAVATGMDPADATVREAMSGELFFCYEDDTVEAAAKLMEDKQICRLPVFSRQNRPVGIVSLGDLAIRNGDDRLSGEVLERVSETPQPYA